MVKQIVSLNIVKDGGMFSCGFERNLCYNPYSSDDSSGPWVLNGLLSSFPTNVDISHDESGMAMDILFKPRVEATQRNR